MNKMIKKSALVTMTIAATGMTFATTALAVEEFSEFVPIVEINATDGDAGFHVLIDGEGWKRMDMYNPDGERIMKARARNNLREQGITELFMESSEPPCKFDEEDPEADVRTVAEFVELFEAGTYTATGRTIDGEPMEAEAELTHKLPAAPKTKVKIDDEEVTIRWKVGKDLGVCDVPDSIPDPAGVEVVRWEVVVEPHEDELPGGELPEGVEFGVVSIQLAADVHSVEIPEEFLEAYLDAGVRAFKGEVGAREESGNQTFTEFVFTIPEDD